MPEKVRVGIIGCGNFARGMHIPNLMRNEKFQIVATCDLVLPLAEEARRLTGAKYAVEDADVVLADPEIDAVFVITRHNSHAELSARAAQAGKHVLCEKPMGMNAEECRRVAAAVRQAGVAYTVGYNRGLAPLVVKAKELLAADPAKVMIYHRIQAPFPADTWTHIPEVGGGRFIGEGCHIFDLLCELVEASPTTVYASGGTFLDPNKVKIPDSGNVTLTFADGSVGTTLIASDGCSEFPKEATEIYWAGKAIYIDNYQRMSYHGVVADGEGSISLKEVDKGHRREIDLFADAILTGAPPPNGLKNATRAALISYLVLDSLSSGQPMRISASDYDV